MTKEQYNILTAELEKRGYKKYMQTTYLGEDWGYFKSPKRDKSDNSLFQIEFAVHDFERFEEIFSDDEVFSVQVNIITSPISDGKRDLILGYDGQSIDDIEKIAASFYEWCENNLKKVNNMELKDTKAFVDYIDKLQILEWSEKERYIEDFGEFENIFCEECFSTTPFGEYNVRYFYYDKAFSLYFNDEKLLDNFQNLDDIKKEANNDYKNKIKSALGL